MFARVANVGKANALQISEGFHLFLTFNSRKLITVDDQVIKCFIADDLTAPAITSIGHQHTQKLTTIGVHVHSYQASFMSGHECSHWLR
jgi:hypothetical protein